MKTAKEYPIILDQIKTDDGLEWEARYPDLPGVVGGGETAQEALEDAEDNLKAHLEFLKEDGVLPPEPTDLEESNYSGKISLRMSKSLHEKVSLIAKKEGISINQFINEAIAEHVGCKEITYSVSNMFQYFKEISTSSWYNFFQDNSTKIRYKNLDKGWNAKYEREAFYRAN
ncbi:MAG: toxin-antitoxin system HicB family antitoxin [Solobacterium sp.]|jgi:predicted HicB family RNase H-like nuclease|nr:toxin-antitoxin system HicB family antitoxin [Solobacterium sp.]MCH4049464.1 toxin-antitoxin system HicB family antitoxin [Solobacterium sp.]MCH4075320.1 toxin-antitoxin system HicB family antitoxin [Solobacterium sp.]